MRHGIRIHTSVLALTALLGVACGMTGGGGRSACDGLVYKEHGLDREEFLPCAGEMVAALNAAKPLLESAVGGDGDGRDEAARQVRAFAELWRQAGGRNLLERWRDGALNNLSVELNNAYTHYSVLVMLPRAAYSQPEGRATAAAELRAGISAHESARNRYEAMLR